MSTFAVSCAGARCYVSGLHSVFLRRKVVRARRSRARADGFDQLGAAPLTAKSRPGGCGHEDQRAAQAPYRDRYCRLLVGAEVHSVDVQDSVDTVPVIEAVHQLFRWLTHLFADSVYNGPIETVERGQGF